MRTEDLVKFNGSAQQYAQGEMQRAALHIREHRLAAKLHPEKPRQLPRYLLLTLIVVLLLAALVAMPEVADALVHKGVDVGGSAYIYGL